MNKLKNFIIVVLVLSAVIQTNILWLENISYHNFFYRVKGPEKKIMHHIAENFRMITRKGKKFSITYKPDEQEKKVTDLAIINILDEGKMSEQTKFNFEDGLCKPIFIYDYNFCLSGENFARCYNKKANNISQINAFDKIFFYEDGTISFVDTLKKKLYKYKGKFVFYPEISERYNFIFNKKFIPAEIISIPDIKINNPYAKNGDIFMNGIAKKLDMFFDNSATKNIENLNNIFTFSNESVLVKYFPSNVLEYTNYKNSNETSDIISDYAAAINFINDDVFVTNNYILKRYEENGNEHKFYFDYIINNLPIEIENDFAKKTGLDNCISISVKNNLVSKYKKIAFNFEHAQSYSSCKCEKYVFNGILLSQF